LPTLKILFFTVGRPTYFTALRREKGRGLVKLHTPCILPPWEGPLSQDYYVSFTSRRQKFEEDFASFGSDLERFCRLAYPEGTFALRDKIACSQFVSGIADSYVKKTFRLEGVNSLKAAIVRARAVKNIQEECYDRKGRKLNFLGKNSYEKKEQENGKAVGKKENVGERKELGNVIDKNRVNVSSRKECWLCGKQGHFRFEAKKKTWAS